MDFFYRGIKKLFKPNIFIYFILWYPYLKYFKPQPYVLLDGDELCTPGV